MLACCAGWLTLLVFSRLRAPLSMSVRSLEVCCSRWTSAESALGWMASRSRSDCEATAECSTCGLSSTSDPSIYNACRFVADCREGGSS